MKTLVAIVLALGLTLGLTGCFESKPEQKEYAAVCVDPNTDERLPDSACDDDSNNYMANAVLWYMLAGSNHYYPSVGGYVNQDYYRTTRPHNAVVRTGLPTTKGKTSTWFVKKYPGSNTAAKSGVTTKSGTSTKSGGSTKSSGGGYKAPAPAPRPAAPRMR